MLIIVLVYSVMIPITHLLESKRKNTFLNKPDIWLPVFTHWSRKGQIIRRKHTQIKDVIKDFKSLGHLIYTQWYNVIHQLTGLHKTVLEKLSVPSKFIKKDTRW